MRGPRLKKIVNSTDVPTAVVRDIIRFVTPENIRPVDYTVRVTNARSHARGRYMGYREPRVLARVARSFRPLRMPLYQYAQNQGKKVTLTSKVEALVYILAHELRHMWQHHGDVKQSSFPTGYAKNARGQFSEIDTESFAVHKLRQWRRRSPAPGLDPEPAAKPATVDRPTEVTSAERLLLRRRAAHRHAAAKAAEWRTRAKRAATLAKRWERRLKIAERRLTS